MQRRFVICLIALSVLLAIDIGTKEWALRRLSVPGGFHRSAPVCEPENSGAVLPVRSPSAPVTVIDGIFEMRYTENCGAAFGLLREAPPWLRKAIFYSAALFASAVLLAMLWRGHGGQIFAVSVPLIVSGALGNWFDRVRFGSSKPARRIPPLISPIFASAWAWDC